MKIFSKWMWVAAALGAAPAAFADDFLSQAFKGCLNQSVVDNQVRVSKAAVDGTSETTLTIHCTGAAAETLFNAVNRYSRENQRYWSDGSWVVSRLFGSLRIPSQCLRSLRSPDGYEQNVFWCHLQLDIVASAIQALNL